MGITGLLPFLEKSSNRTNINQFTGGTVAIDTYCWLHKGVFSCAEKLAMGQPTDAYVQYCMRFINMLLSYKIKPILVFDGRHLPAKAETEAKRHESRETNRSRAAELIRMGQVAEGRTLLRRSIDVTHTMALEVIKQCHKLNIDCIVAPYEADAQLAYLNVSGIADVVITEDSDLTLFGCKRVFFKMDQNGNGLLIEQDKLYLAMGTRPDNFDYNKFRYMCILSGCDYLASLPGIGLSKAKKFITANAESDIHKALIRLNSYLNMKTLVVSKEYRDAFIQALITFKHQLVYCPLQRKQVRLTPPTSDITEEQLKHTGEEVEPDLALQLALGNCDPFTFKMLHDFDPDKPKENEINSRGRSIKTKHVSIWSPNYNIKKNLEPTPMKDITKWLNTNDVKREKVLRKPDNVEKVDQLESEELSVNNILKMYGHTDTKSIGSSVEKKQADETTHNSVEDEPTSPVLPTTKRRSTKGENDNNISPSLLMKGRSCSRFRNLLRFKKTVIDENIITKSKFFVNNSVDRNIDVTDGRIDLHNPCSEEMADCGNSVNSTTESNIHHRLQNPSQNEDLQSDDELQSNIATYNSTAEYTPASLTDMQNTATKQNGTCMSSTMRIEHVDRRLHLESGIDMCESNNLTDVASDNENDSLRHSTKRSRSVSPDSEKDYLVNIDNCRDVESRFFTSPNSRLPKTSIKEIDCKKGNSKQTTAHKRTRLGSQVPLGKASQQSLLSMYGFKKKNNLKH